ncbi:MAG: HTH-type transcriptional regulator GltC [Desulfovibrio sp.]
MDLQRLRYFKAVAQMEHMSKAAQQLHITQPALSKAIALLEEEVGGPLFARVGRKIALNENGKTFYRYAEQALAAIDDGMRFVREMSDSSYDRIKFQTNIVARQHLAELVAGFRAMHPRTRFEIIATYSKTKFMLDCDCYITAKRIPLYQCTSVPIYSEEIVLGVPPHHPLAQQESINLAEAALEPFVGISENYSWTREVEEFCLKAGFTPNVVYVVDSIDLTAQLVALGEGVAFFPVESSGVFPGVKLLHIDSPHCSREFVLSWQTHRHLSEPAAAFLAYVKAHFADVMQNGRRMLP